MTTQLDIFSDPPVHTIDPESSRRAARAVRRKATGQAARILDLLVERHPDCLTTREIQVSLFDGQPVAQNKVATRLRALWEAGMVERLSASSPWRPIPWFARDEIEALTAPYEDQGSFLVYRATRRALWQ